MEERKACRSDTLLSRCGSGEGFRFEEGGAHLEAPRGRYLSRVYDSGIKEMEWDHLCIAVNGPAQLTAWVLVGMEAPTALDDPSLSWLERSRYAQEHAALTTEAPNTLLYGVKGRYLRLYLELTRVREGTAGFFGYEIIFPKQSVVTFLPEIFQGDGLLERYTAIYQNAYENTSRMMNAFPGCLEPRTADSETLHLLAAWLGITGWLKGANEEQARLLVEYGVELNRLRGTRRGLELLTELLTGSAGTVLEPPGERLAFSLLIPPCPEQAKHLLLRILPDFCPLGTVCTPVSLQEAQPVGGHCYLGVNARLSGREVPKVGENARLGQIRLE